MFNFHNFRIPNLSKLIKTVPLLLFLTSLALPSVSQPLSLDSLKDELAKTKSDTLRVRLLASLGSEYTQRENIDSSLLYLNQALKLAVQSKYTFGEANCLNYLGRHYTSIDQYYLALDHYLKCLSLEDYPQAKKVKMMTVYDLGQLYGRIAANSLSPEISARRISYFKQVLRMLKADSFEDEEEITFGVLNELGRAYMTKRPEPDYDSAEIYFQSSIASAKKIGYTFYLPSVYNDIANLWMMKGNLPKAIDYQHTAIRSAKTYGTLNDITILYETMSRLQRRNNNYDSALFYIRLNTNDHSNAAQILGEIYIDKKEYRKAIKVYSTILENAKKSHNNIEYQIGCNNLAYCFEKVADYKNALKYTQLALESDSLRTNDLYLKMATIQSEFDLAQHQSNINLLAKEASIQNLTLRKNKTIQLLIAGLLLITIIVAGIVTFQYRKIVKSKRLQEKTFRQVDEMKSRFFANISHEFRTPLTLILSPIQKKLALATSNEEKFEYMVMEKNAKLLLSLVTQLLELSRIESGSFKLTMSKENISGLLRLVTSQFESLAITKGINFHIDIEEKIYATVDEEKLKTIVNNLLSNAFKFTPHEGEIKIVLTHVKPLQSNGSDAFSISISDNGPGIAREHHKRIFDRFYQVDDSTTRRFEGTGIGLALTKELVELHGGTISVSSEVGMGASFTVRIPLNLGSQQPPSTQSTESNDRDKTIEAPIVTNSPEPDASEMILLVEDNKDLREYLKNELQNDYVVIEANDGSAGIAASIEKLPTLIISDLMMPGTDGLHLCEALKNDERTSHIPIILLTAKADIESRLTGYNTGADDYMAKPFDARELLTRIKNIIQNRKRLHAKYTTKEGFRPSTISVESVDDRFLKKALQIIEQNMDVTSFGVTEFAKEIGMSSVQLYRKLHALTGYSTNDLIRHIRLLRACDLLQQKAGNVADIAYKVGFNNLSYFSKVYKEKFGHSPSEELK